MSIIQQIRDKAAWLVFGLIALSLVGFLLMDANSGKSRLFGSRSTTVGEVNGEKIEYTSFEKMVTDEEQQWKDQNKQPVNEAVQQNIRDNVWHQMIEDAILSSDYAALGIDVSDKEINDMLVGADATPDIRRAFTDPKTGIFDAQQAANQINNLRNLYKAGPKKNADPRQYEGARRFFEEGIPQLIKMRLREKYMGLLANSAYVPKWMIEKMNADNSQLASISYVNTPYFTIPDSAAKVTDAEIEDYINQHKDRFQQEESRSIAYVTVDASPNSADSTKLKQQLTELSKEFAQATDAQAFLARVGSATAFLDAYEGKARIQVPSKDSILALTKGATYGPYLDGPNYTVAKLVDVKTLPDSVHARHILVETYNPQTQQAVLDDSTAKKRIDSVQYLLEHGASWDSVALRYSDDGSKTKGGDLGMRTPDGFVKEFGDFTAGGKKGEKKIVKTIFGYHYIEILDQKNFEPAYKVAYLSRKIETSTETGQAASGLASQFAGESRDARAFDENAQKYHLPKSVAPDVTPAEFTIPGVGPNRQLVKWVYEAELGKVSEPYSVGDKYVVALLTEINKPGLMTTAKGRSQIEPILRNKKKADQIIKKEGSPASLDAAATAAGQPVQHADSVMFASTRNMGQEGKLVGTAFDKQLIGKPISPAIPGNTGVFFIKVENVSAMSNPGGDLQQQQFMQEQQLRSMVMYGLTDALRKLATVKDYRGTFF